MGEMAKNIRSSSKPFLFWGTAYQGCWEEIIDGALEIIESRH